VTCMYFSSRATFKFLLMIEMLELWSLWHRLQISRTSITAPFSIGQYDSQSDFQNDFSTTFNVKSSSFWP
jgi:hypothetical protein